MREPAGPERRPAGLAAPVGSRGRGPPVPHPTEDMEPSLKRETPGNRLVGEPQMRDERKTKAQLVEELRELRDEIRDLGLCWLLLNEPPPER